MKKIIFLIISIIAISYVQAQDLDIERINHDWNGLVDYVTIKYNQAILEYRIQDEIQDENLRKDYQEKIHSVLDKQNINECMPIDTFLVLVKSVIPDYEFIDLSPNKYVIVEQLLDGNILFSKGNKELKNIIVEMQDALREEIISKYSSHTSHFVEENDDSMGVTMNENSTDNLSCSLPLWVIIMLSILLVAVAFLYILNYQLKQKLDTIRITQNEQDNDLNLQRNLAVQSQNQQYKAIQDAVGLLKDRISDWDRKLASQQNQQPSQVQKSSIEEKRMYIYLKNYQKGVLRKCSQEDAQFRLLENAQGRAEFEFCGKDDYAIANRNEVFDDVCELSGIYYNAKRIVNEQHGIAYMISTDKWQVEKKAKVKFE